MFRIAPASIFFCAFVLSAAAADLTNSRTTAPASSEEASPWSGFYIGAHAGLAAGETEIGGLQSYGLGNPWDLTGATAGIQAGFNHQIGSLVTGIEADYAYAAIAGSVSGRSTFYVGTPYETAQTSTISADLRQMATIRPRIGFAFDRSLIYASAGLVTADLELRSTTTVTQAADPSNPRTFSSKARNVVFGWTLGAGYEHALTTSLSLKAEYQFVTLDRNREGEKTEGLYQGHLGKLGLNYRF